ncbi:putative lipoprotein LppI [Mycobacterium kansasii 732]|uniref:hypothetical protein n=1 Tax=Mycobacterium pseudokansasii TaxID=2341080 RepID=UPI00044AEFD6|nr:hypothetical protein [Mycobacterium pseudokansasii]EUA06315.1 putative lipoprotein LppI [Mycobacterium kansasii 732]MBY0387353.1 hypothetical protein [Mycobacterium pseudokansasii]
MRIAVLVAVPLLVAGCSHDIGSRPEQSPTSTPTPAGSSASSLTSTPTAGTAPPAAGAPISAVVAWIAAGRPADPAHYHSVSRDGVTTDLGDDIAFAAQSGKASCLTDSKHTGSALICLVSLSNPPPPPATAYGEWKPGWVDFEGTTAQVGAARGDPGPFVNGNGPELANGDSLSFGDYRCRADQAGLFCVNYAHQSAVRLSAGGVEPFGCLRSVPPPDGVGTAFSC